MPYPNRLAITVTIRGVDVTAYIDTTNFNIQSVLSHQVDTCQLKLLSANALTVNGWDELIVTDGATRIFGGFVLLPNETPDDGVEVDKTIGASDYSVRFEKVMISKVYTNKTDYQIINDLFTIYGLGTEGYDFTTYVESLVTHPQFVINQKSLTEVLNYLAQVANADWYVDPYKRLHFFITQQNLAPYGISDSPDLVTTFPATAITKKMDATGVVNRVTLMGGMYLSDDQDFYLAGNGVDNRAAIPFFLHAPDGQSSIQLYRNDGTYASPVWTPLTVGVGYINTLGATYTTLFYFQDKVIQQANPWPNLGNAVWIHAKSEIPLIVREVDLASYAFYGNRYFDEVLVDTTITVKATAQNIVEAELMGNSLAQVAGTITTAQPGLRAGQVITVNYQKPAIQGTYLIQRCTITIGINGQAQYSFDFGCYNPELVDLLIGLARQSGPVAPWRTDQVLNDLLQTPEKVTAGEQYTLTTTTGPYYFSNVDAEAMWIGAAGDFEP